MLQKIHYHIFIIGNKKIRADLILSFSFITSKNVYLNNINSLYHLLLITLFIKLLLNTELFFKDHLSIKIIWFPFGLLDKNRKKLYL